MLPELLSDPLPPHTMWNINVPDGPENSLQGYRITRQGSRTYHDVINDLSDPRGRPLVWIAGKGPSWRELDETDYLAVRDGYASMTPLQVDLTNHEVWRRHAERGGALPGEPVFGADGDRFVLRRETAQGLVFEGPTRGGDAPIGKVEKDRR
jgi:5'-nucleotidase